MVHIQRVGDALHGPLALAIDKPARGLFLTSTRRSEAGPCVPCRASRASRICSRLCRCSSVFAACICARSRRFRSRRSSRVSDHSGLSTSGPLRANKTPAGSTSVLGGVFSSAAHQGRRKSWRRGPSQDSRLRFGAGTRAPPDHDHRLVGPRRPAWLVMYGRGGRQQDRAGGRLP